jgi:hypothetical protein
MRDDRLDRLSPEKKAMLEKLLREKRLKSGNDGPVIKPIKLDSNRYPLTIAQEKIWIANSINPNATIYNMTGVARVQGNARIEWFIDALNESFHRHEILRMHFKQDGEELYLEFDENMSFEPELYDFSDEGRDRDEVIEEMVQKLAKKPFDTETDTLIRAALVCTAPDDWTVLLVMHHLVGDALSVNLVLGEALEYCYNKYNNIENSRPALPIQFKDFAWWERNKDASTPSAKAAEKYWSEQLDDADFSLAIVTEKQDLTHFDDIALWEGMHIGADVVRKIQDIAQKNKITVFSIYFAALKLLIYKYSMQQDFMTGVVTAGRDFAEVQPMVGCFVDILPVRTVIDESLTFTDFARDFYKKFLENYEKKDAYLRLGESPLYQLLFNYRETVNPDAMIDGVDIQFHDIDTGYSRASMDFELIKSGT